MSPLPAHDTATSGATTSHDTASMLRSRLLLITRLPLRPGPNHCFEAKHLHPHCRCGPVTIGCPAELREDATMPFGDGIWRALGAHRTRKFMRSQRIPLGPRDHQMPVSLPTSRSVASGPNIRESLLLSRLSPTTKTRPAGTVRGSTGPARLLVSSATW